MEAREYLDRRRDEHRILRLAHYTGDECDGRGDALILDDEHHIAVMLQDCGFPDISQVQAGALVKYIRPTGAEPRIVGSPAYTAPVVLGGRHVS